MESLLHLSLLNWSFNTVTWMRDPGSLGVLLYPILIVSKLISRFPKLIVNSVYKHDCVVLLYLLLGLFLFHIF